MDARINIVVRDIKNLIAKSANNTNKSKERCANKERFQIPKTATCMLL